MKRLLAGAAAAVVLALVVPGAASAGAAWAIQPVPMPAKAVHASLAGVSCWSKSGCITVGAWDASGSSQPLAERWNGHAWAIQPTPQPAGASRSGLAAVSCATAASCLAVGTIPAEGSILGTPLAESWDGSTWTIQSIPSPPASTGTLLTGLSCASPTSCVATGYYDTGTITFQALAEHWDGSTWTIQAIPVSPDTENSQLNAVSCVSAASCTAVGSYTRGVPAEVTGRGALAEYWNGTAWRQVQTTHPSGHNLMYGVSCLFPRTCTAVGAIRQSGIDAGQKTTPLAEQE